MSQKTNLNVSPYYDDFDPNKNFYRVLFKPGFPVQSRELTTLQSILQNQIETFGSHIFKDGSVVIPGNISYNSEYYAVKINPTHVGLSVGLYLNELVGKKIKGQTSGLVAIVQKVLLNTESETEDYTLYVKYISSDSSFQISQFRDSETLILQENLVYGNTTIASGDTFATLINQDATSTASAVSISNGVYFIRGHFVSVSDDTLILDQYTNTPSYRVGLYVSESLVDAKEDNTLYDNARGFSNYAAPGADRLKISASLTKKRLDDLDDKNFIEVLRISNGVVKKIQDSNTYSLIKEYIAERTYEESGNYSVDPFEVDVEDSLNDGLNSSGVFFSNQLTDQGNTPSENLLALKVSPGKAYVRGFDVEKSVSTILDIEKPRDTIEVSNSAVPFEMGSLLKVNRVSGTPVVGIDNNHVIYLNNQRKNSSIVGTGETIGKARVYSFSSPNEYENDADNWDLYLYDIQTYTKITLNQALTSGECPETSFIKGMSSGASGYVVGTPSGNDINVQQTSGTFTVGEQLLINGSTSYSRTVSAVKVFGTQDIKSVFQDAAEVGLSTSFVADTFLQTKIAKNFTNTDSLEISATGVATCAGKNFVGIKSDTIIKYQLSGNTLETFNRVESVSNDGLTMTLVAVPTVSGVCNGALPTSTVTTTFSLGVPSIQNEENSFLYAKINSKNVSDVNLSSSDLTVRRQVTGKSTSSAGTLAINLSDVGITSAYFQPYNNERYSIFYDDGSVDQLSSDKVSLSSNSTVVTFTGLTPNESNVVVNATVKKNSITNKQKLYIRSNRVDVTQTVSGVSTAISGLTSTTNYGLRVEDEEISLNVPDAVKVLAVYESVNNGQVVLDKLTFTSGLGLDTESILGEKIVGSTSGAIAQIVTRVSSTEIEFVYLNSNTFVANETVKFEESGISGAVTTVLKGTYTNKTSDYVLDKGQKEQYYDYSRIVRKTGASVPSKRLVIFFDYYEVPTNDAGDLYTVKSYGEQRYKNDIPVLKSGYRASDVLDFRPRVADFNSTTTSPFAFSSRNFASAGSNPTLVVSPNETSNVTYSYYLPRIDKISLNKNGNIVITKGVSADSPKEPTTIEESMDLARIEYPAYLYDVNDVKVYLFDNRRYTMRDIGKLEDRISNVEKLASLTLLELNTKTLQIQDADGLSRFKSGFFVDNFDGTDFINIDNPDAKICIDTNNDDNEMRSDVSSYSLKSQVSPSASLNANTEDFSSNFALQDSNVKKTGDLVTLNYSEVAWTNLSQGFATKEQEINPFGVANYNGFVKLTPASDTWVRTLNSENGIVRTQSNWENTYIGNLNPSSSPNGKFRSRNVEFRSSGLKPATNYYSFFGGSSNIDIIPKLLKITMVSGVFESGETVYGYINGRKVAAFRVANSNHKSGKYNLPSTTFSENPYSPSTTINSYSSSSTVLNIDTYSLADNADGRFYGYAPSGMRLVGNTSSAQATVQAQTLTTDSVGDLIGCFFIRNPLQNPAPPVSLKVGSKSFKLSSSSTNSSATNVSFTETTFYGSGIVDSSTYTESLIVRKSPPALPLNALRRDPLAQTFRTDNEGGFLTAVDLYFSGKDSTEKLFVEIRETDIGGTPKDKLIQDFARIEVLPSDITVSSDGQTATKLNFPSPIYLQPNKQYALAVSCPSSDDYKVWIAESNKATVTTQSYPNAEQVIYSNQYIGGNLFKPQNGSIWNSSLLEDLKFKFYKANFTSTSGTVFFHNPTLSIGSTHSEVDANLPILINNPIKTLPRKLNVGIVTSFGLNTLFQNGLKVAEGDTYGYIESVGGNIGVVTSTKVGAGYSNGTYSGVPLYSITGNGSGATANLTIVSNQLASISIANTGTGYRTGDLLGITTSAMTKGSGATVTVQSVPNIDKLYLTNVSGEEFGSNQTLSYYEGDTQISLAGTATRGSSTIPSDLYSGNVFEVIHYNHGMHSNSNIVNINGVAPNTSGEPLTASIISSNTTISVANTSNFTTFEGVNVSGSNPGYIIVNEEIISYTSVSSNALNIGERGIDESVIRNHAVGDLIYKYELNGVSLTRINNSHTMPSNGTLSSARGIDSYHLQFDRSDKSSGDSQLSFTDASILGGSNCRATQNIQFNEIIPQFNVISPENTTVSSTLRTVSGTSAGGSETSFIDQGYENVTLNQVNQLNTPRIICSRVNESNYLSSLPRSKSLTFAVRMQTNNINVSPVIDLTEAATFILNRNRLNRPILDYAKDPRSNQLSDDPHASVYISNRINLLKPASSLKVILTAYRNASSDFRVLYQLFRADSSEISQTYELFPGYSNLTDTDGDGIGDTVIDVNLNDGSSDVFVNASNDDQFLEYQYTADELEQFTGFAIKIVMNGTNEAYAPRFRDLRAIALA